ncbi:MAG: tRNA1(Val) (adenine(37)-N6)-methyltransferase [Defluviitaleaceae bacterium]|nr:tRNA1(Val) (adenine(37)-N6)-methyltransferase [Defluviitaleaceae bacterium]
MDKVKINDNERLDDLHRSGYMIIQNPKYFCFGIDAVLLSGFATVNKDETVLDLGTGSGVIPILLSAKTEAKHLSGIEIQEDSANMAARSVEYNALGNKIAIIHGDVKEIKTLVKPHSFEVVTANPPYMEAGSGLLGAYSSKAIARHEVLLSLDDVIYAASYSLKWRGRFYMVHRPSRLTDIICTLRKHKLEPKQMRFVQPYGDKEPNLVLIEALYGGGKELKVMPPLVIYDSEGNYTKECCEIYYG